MSTNNVDDRHDVGSREPEALVGQAVMLFHEGRIASELRLAEFNSILTGAAAVEQFRGEAVQAVYCEIGSALVVRAMVFFVVNFDAQGRPPANFALPLGDLAQRAGAGPDLGFGRTRLACRAQCPISWFATHLWQPRSLGSDGECAAVQKAATKNRMGFRGQPGVRSDATLDGRIDGRADGRLDGRMGATRGGGLNGTMNGGSTLNGALGGGQSESGRIVVPQLVRQYQVRLEALEGERQKTRDQLNRAKTEIARLGAELNQERERSRRLEQLLRGSELA